MRQAAKLVSTRKAARIEANTARIKLYMLRHNADFNFEKTAHEHRLEKCDRFFNSCFGPEPLARIRDLLLTSTAKLGMSLSKPTSLTHMPSIQESWKACGTK